MPTTCDFEPGECVLGGQAPITVEDGATASVDLTLREDMTAVAGVDIDMRAGEPRRVRFDDLEVPVEPGDDLRAILIRAAEVARTVRDAPPPPDPEPEPEPEG